MTVQFKRRLPGTVVDGFETVAYGPWFDVEGCLVEYVNEASEDDRAGRDKVVHAAVVYAPPLDDMPREYDMARLPDDMAEYDVINRPARWRRVGTEIRLGRVAG
ncbi:hypothetical protein [Paenarthrobacter nitroguajacolicus]|uniref:hypothetical protein n=1 Tax=Paenarthrobacter nitroguajacolicus TaxID=211146 RepID=UPI00248CE9C1|nr:hypothetical protein [Paenarthrobacter nitroguajacolicus]